MPAKIEIERQSDLMIVTNDFPETRNALNADFYTGFADTLAKANVDPTIGAIVLTGGGNFFCAGGDLNRLKKFATTPEPERRDSITRLHAMIKAIADCSKPIIAAVEGGAAGAGVSLAAACDLIVMADDAYFSVAYVKIGLSPDGGATALLAQSLPRQLMTEMCLTGDKFGAARLLDAGVVNRVVSAGSALQEATAWAADLAKGPARSMARIKSLCRAARENSLIEQLEMEEELMISAQTDPESIEGISAFLEKRPADYTKLRRDK